MGDIVAVYHVCYKLPFLILLLFAQWECVLSMDQVPVCCHFMFQQVVGKEIDGGISGVRFAEDAYAEVGWFSSYGEVEEVNGVCGFHRRT